MTYFGFHLRFNLPLLALLTLAAGPRMLDPGSLQSAGLVLAAVFLFTVPWDNFAAARGIYEAEGFRLVRREAHESFGKPLDGEYWELEL